MRVNVGDQIVFPGCGVGRVEARETMAVGDESVDTWRIVLLADEATVWVPVMSVDEKGLRPVMDVQHVPRTWEILTSQEAPSTRKPWPQRRRRYTEMLLESSPASLASLLGELVAVRRGNEAKKKMSLSFTEKRYFEQARGMLVQEIAAARGVAAEVVEAHFESLTLAVA